MSDDAAAVRASPRPAGNHSLSWGYALGSGALCGLGSALLMGAAVAVVFSFDSLRESTDDSLSSTVTEGLGAAVFFFLYGSMIASLVAVPAGLILGAVNGALVRRVESPALALLAALVVAMPLGAALPAVLFGGWSWLSLLSAVCAGIAAESQVHLLLRRAGRAEVEPDHVAGRPSTS